jgi:hypothetical protein
MNNGSPLVRTNVFVSYSRKDRKFLDELHAHLEYHIRRGVITSWDDRQISPGNEWKKEIIQAVNSTKVAVFLVDADFLASEFIEKHELNPLLKAAEHEGVIILPVILGACMFEDTALSHFQAVNNPGLPLNMMSRGQRDLVWVNLAKSIKKEL